GGRHIAGLKRLSPRTPPCYSAAAPILCAASTRCVDCLNAGRRACLSSSAPQEPANRRSCVPACGRDLIVTTVNGCRCGRYGAGGEVPSRAMRDCLLRSKRCITASLCESAEPTCACG